MLIEKTFSPACLRKINIERRPILVLWSCFSLGVCVASKRITILVKKKKQQKTLFVATVVKRFSQEAPDPP